MAQAQFWRQNEDKKYCDKVATQLGHLCKLEGKWHLGATVLFTALLQEYSEIFSWNMSLKGWDTCIFSRQCNLTEEGEKLITRDLISSHLIKGHLLESSPLSIWTKWWTVLCRHAPFICNCPPDIRSGAVEDVILCVKLAKLNLNPFNDSKSHWKRLQYIFICNFNFFVI